eukprot:CAMPEP_0170612060 /NCGR_PEP_ID=MMETSP0224-20130122/23524_1 /TAXON_ID=285029 /ORGANISM="Togula jolla, Strain CCCM 725" /LENGTH=422 /DNA_ID=CAMNT_0010937543 /DNA_START=70 /DNA_END=1338 /DNA_ORIENTATION=-
MESGAYGSVKAQPYDLEHAARHPIFKIPARRKMNLWAILLSLILPWLVFVVVVSVMAFKIRYRHPYLAFAAVICCIIGVIYFACFAGYGYREKVRSDSHEPTWYIFAFITSLLALVLGLILGCYIWSHFSMQYYDSSTLKVYGLDSGNSTSSGGSVGGFTAGGGATSGSGAAGANGVGSGGGIDPVMATGTQLLDAGIVFFSQGSYIDVSKAMSFGSDPSYCVAPITRGNIPVDTYDFWAVGENCCGHAALPKSAPQMPPPADEAPTFKCGEYDNPYARAGLRAMGGASRPYYRLAVTQAEAAYNIKAHRPVFFFWMEDPINGGASSRESWKYGSRQNGTLSPFGNGFTFDGAADKGLLWGLLPFTWADLGLSPPAGGLGGAGGTLAKFEYGQKLHTYGIFTHFCLQFLLVTCAACAFSNIG